MSVYGNVNGFAIMGDNRLVDVDALESQLAEKDKEIALLNEQLDRWRKGYNTITRSHYEEEIERMQARLSRIASYLRVYHCHRNNAGRYVWDTDAARSAHEDCSRPNLPSGPNESPASGGNFSGES